MKTEIPDEAEAEQKKKLYALPMPDRELYGLLRDNDGEAWRIVFECIVKPFAGIAKYSEMMRKWNTEAAELFSKLYWEMVYRKKLDLYKGGELGPWFARYLHGYVMRCKPDERNVSLDAPVGGAGGGDGGDGDAETTFEENIVRDMSENGRRDACRPVDLAMERNLAVEDIEKCFAALWRQSPLKAYVMLLKHRLNLSSTQIKEMLLVSSAANVDQMSSRATKEIGKLRDAL